MTFKPLETVVLDHDLPAHDLRAGDLGAIVEIYPDGDLEVEFVRGSGHTKALLTLSPSDVRAIAPTDVPAVRTA